MEYSSQSSSSEERIDETNEEIVSESDDISDSTDSDTQFEEESQIEKLREWAIECKIAQVHLDKLLEILKTRLLPTLPKSSKTFLRKTDAN